MTVCIAALFRWPYGKNDIGTAVVTASDRMITAGDVEYEPAQLKIGFLSRRVLILIAGDYTVHSHAIKEVQYQVRSNQAVKPYDVACMYGTAIQSSRRRQAEDLILAPLGLNTDSFLAQQRDMSEGLISSLTTQMQDFQGPDVEALVVGMENDVAHIYIVDRHGTVGCYDDVGFAAIGIGAWHARSRLMQNGYVNTVGFAPALAAIYAAKKSSEVAPGVGKATDMHLMFRGGSEPLWPATAQKLSDLYIDFEKQQTALAASAIADLAKFIEDPKNGPKTLKEAAHESTNTQKSDSVTVQDEVEEDFTGSDIDGNGDSEAER